MHTIEMARNGSKSKRDLSALRKRAEKKLTEDKDSAENSSFSDLKSLIQELRTHQIELEMQNEELRQAVQGLEESRHKCWELYDFSPVGYFTFDKKGLIKEVNLTGASLLSVDRKLLINSPFSIFVDAGGQGIFRAHLKSALDSNAVQTAELQLHSKDGAQFYIQMQSIAHTDREGNLYCRAAVTDITERKYAEKELERSNADLQQFAYAASHDLREPLRTIAGFVKLIEKRYKGRLDEKADEFIQYTLEGVSRMEMLINDLLEYSRVETKGGSFKPVNCSVAIEKAIFNLRSAIEESGAGITYDLLPRVSADEAQITCLFQNLIGNAIKFRGKEKLKIHVSAEQKDNEWIFCVRDNGIGIDPHFFDRVFVIFQRLHTKQEYEGTGIGLAISKRIVERHGGRIWVESKPGAGAAFYFTLPVANKP